jgi:hypothetical protein
LPPVKYELGFYIPEDILHSHHPENPQNLIVATPRDGDKSEGMLTSVALYLCTVWFTQRDFSQQQNIVAC